MGDGNRVVIMSNRSPYTDDHLRVKSGTTPDDIYEFVLRRATNPEVIGGEMTVWNFNNHALNHDSLEGQMNDLTYDEYMIPFQVSGVWATMFNLLPERLKELEILTYSQKEGKYVPFPNYYRHSDEQKRDEITDQIREFLDQEGI